MLSGKILKTRGWPEGKVIGLAKAAAQALEDTGMEREAVLDQLDRVREDPGAFLAEPRFADLARECVRRMTPEPTDDALRERPASYGVWGAEQIDRVVLTQMEQALRLPIAIEGALMPDAHVGYGLPIGGVLATDAAVIPYAVGVDIACRMRLSVYPVSPYTLGQRRNDFKRSLMERTRFGQREGWARGDFPEHPVLEDPAWSATRLLKSLQFKAEQQLGTSGSGNHFVEWGVFRLYADDADLGLTAGEYLALLSHSGSRAVGFKIANTFTELAAREHPHLDASVQRLAWLTLGSEAGQDYWLSMELAGRFASANHYVIHQRVAAAVGLKEVAVVENHHNFAWRETLPDGSPAIVHRKGATPAGAGVLGVIPGSMGDAGYVVRGRGEPSALNSASHGAGRAMSRRAAENSISRSARDEYLRERGVTLLGGGIDESPQAYKPIETVIAAQDDLVEVIGKFTPRLVRMADEAGDF
ncbi:MAG TPA: RtcB family protein [Ktedonobacterales bacterium]|nr:RtcB family protein [Ktedonobacterales bacterium]